MEAKSTKHPKTDKKPSTHAKQETVVVEAHHSNKAGIIIGVILGFVAAALVVFAFVWSCIYHSPSKVASDAMNKFFSAESVAINGTITLEATDRSSELKELIIFFDSASTALPNATNVHVVGSLRNGAHIDAGLGLVQLSDGVLYIKVDHLVDTLASFGIDEDDLSWFYEVVETADNEWWRIDLTEIVASLELDQSEAERIENLKSCVMQELDQDIRKEELGSLYNRNDFVGLAQVEEVRFADGSGYGKSFDGTNYYALQPDFRKLAGFINGLADLNTMDRIYQCIGDNYPEFQIAATDFDEVTAGELQTVLSNDASTEVFLEISKWGHELKAAVARVANSNFVAVINLAFIYNSTAEVTTPTDYRSATELIDQLTDILAELYIRNYLESNGIFAWE